MSGRLMNWAAPTSSEISYVTYENQPDLFLKITSVSIFGNTDEFNSWIYYTRCCMLENQDEWMSDAELNDALNYTDGYAMKINAQFSTTISGLYWN